MVEFALSEEQEMLRELAHEFARDIVRPNAEHWDDKSEFPTEAIAEAHALGLTNLHIPAEYGGMGMEFLTKYWSLRNFLGVIQDLAQPHIRMD